MTEPSFSHAVLDLRKKGVESLPLEPERVLTQKNKVEKDRMGKEDPGKIAKPFEDPPAQGFPPGKLRPLSNLNPGEKGRVRDIPDEGTLRKVLSLGIYPGDTLLVIRKKPLIVFRIGASQFTFDHRLASGIYVE
jgi:Fe2+ transport system protein FeoA